mgnify:FL=1
MATFEARVESASGLSIDGSSSPTTTELTEFLKDGVIDVTNRCIELKPEISIDFTRESSEITSQAGIQVNGARIISVVRETGTNNDWRRANQISPGSQSRATDSSSLEYATKYNPAYMIGDDAKISIFPSPDSSNNAYKLYYVNNAPVDKSGASLLYSHSDIGYFSDEKVYLVILYASFQSLLNALSAIAIGESIPSWTAPSGFVKPSFSAPSLTSVGALTLPSVPSSPVSPSFTTPDITTVTTGTMPDIASTTISNVGTPPTYTAPKVGGATEELTASIEAATAGEATDKYDYSRWFDLVADYIEDEEDVELATAQLQKIRAYVETYSIAMQSNLNTFNKEKAEYDAKLQEAIQQAQINAQKATQQAQIDASKVTTDVQIEAAEKQQEAALLLQKENQEYAANLQKYSGEVGAYQAEVNAKVQEWINEEWTQKFQKYTVDYANKLQTYANDIQNESLKFDKDIQKEAQSHAAAINEVAAEIQLDTSEYNWMSQRYAALKGQYDQAFGLMAPREGKD